MIPDQSNVETTTIIRQEDSVAIQCMSMGNDCKGILLSLARGIDRVNTKLNNIDKTLAENQVVTLATEKRVEELEKTQKAISMRIVCAGITLIGGALLYLITGKA